MPANGTSFAHAGPESSGKSGRGLPLRGVYPTPSYIGAPGHSRARLPEGVGLLWASQRGKAMTEVSRYCRCALSSTSVALSHSTDAKEAKCNRGAPYIYWGYSRWVLASTIVALSQYGSKAGSNDMRIVGTVCMRCTSERGKGKKKEKGKKRSRHDIHLMSGSHRTRLPVMRCTSERGKGKKKEEGKKKSSHNMNLPPR